MNALMISYHLMSTRPYKDGELHHERYDMIRWSNQSNDTTDKFALRLSEVQYPTYYSLLNLLSLWRRVVK